MSVLGAAREFLERELALCTQGANRAREREIAERVCELIESEDWDEYRRLLVLPLMVSDEKAESAE